MSLPIKETPILTGKDAVRFLKRMEDLEVNGPTEKDREDYKRAREVYDRMKAAGMGDLP